MSISAVLKAAGHKCDVFIEGEEKNLDQCILDYQPDLVAFSVVTDNYVWSLEQARQIKSIYDTKTIFGGVHPTIFPEIILEDSIDIICRGEGEYALLDLMNTIDQRKDYSAIKNLWTIKSGEVIKNAVRPLIQDLNEIPPLDRELYYKYSSLKDYPVRNIMITRGCPYPCSFCFNHQFNKLYQGKGDIVRRKSVENSIKELAALKKHETRLIMFWDDTFTLDKNWLFKFLEIYRKEIGLPFFCNARVEHLDEKTVESLKKAGVHCVDFGIETGNEERRRAVLNKNISNQKFLDAAELLHKYKICINAENILAIPGETLETAWETVEFNRRIKPTYAWCSIFKPYPKLALTEKAINQGLIKEEDLKNLDKLTYYENSILNMPHVSEICNLQKIFNLAVQFPSMDFLIRFLIKLPLKKFYLWIFIISYGFGYKKVLNLTYANIIRKGVAILKSYSRK